MNNFPAMPVLTQEQQKIITDTCNVMVNRTDSSEYSQNLRVVAQIALAALAAEPEYYFRKRSDGGREGPIHHTETEDSRKVSWSPLYTVPPAPALRVPDGWKLVPENATGQMVSAWRDAIHNNASIEGAFFRMVDAAPLPPPPEASNEQ